MASTDSMLMNFSVGDGPLTVNQTFKGGRWKDRLSAKKFARNRVQKPSPESAQKRAEKDGSAPENVAGDTSPADDSSPRPNKRQRLGNDTAPHRNNSSGGNNPIRGQTRDRPEQVISSLFSFNPASNTPTSKASELQNEPITPSNAPMLDGLQNFTGLQLSPTISAHLLSKLDLKAPTAIQKTTIPQLISDDSDAFIQAQTGSGKTLAYLLPIVQRIMAMSEGSKGEAGSISRSSGTYAIILAPTRELCKQISTVLENVLRCVHWIVAGAVFGGEKKKSEKARLRKGLNILVATPGRLADHLDNTEVLDVSNVRWLVLDEGDRLMELGFEEEIKGIVTKIAARSKISRPDRAAPGLPTRRVTVLCSATMKMNVQRLGEISLKDAVHLKAEEAEEDKSKVTGTDDSLDLFSAPAQLKQSYAVVPAKQRLVTLNAVLRRAFARRGSVMKAIIFMSCADSVNFHFQVFTRPIDTGDEAKDEKKPEIKSDTIAPMTSLPTSENPVIMYKLHGSLPQAVRTSTLAAFSRSKEPAVLVCTDVASRGLDLPNVEFVIEYDPPYSKGDHLHRVGRTARAGRDGRALIFLLPGDEEGYVSVLKEVYRDGGVGLARNEPDEMLKRGFVPNGKVTSHDWEEKATEWQLDIERWALEKPQVLEQARRAFQSHVRAYATHVASERSIFNIKTLHLGHLAKAFGLRDRPGKMNVPGLRPTKESGRSNDRRNNTNEGTAADGTDHGATRAPEGDSAAKKMRKKMKEHMAGISEFNIG
ncbi:MAG: hypothetical protein M4579_004831 [Chaenotheca gracillima]|nr:MAG: hypothetical protein M4579_004831 [Chaenotheca gracillima]